jgi:hypothetical protein
MATTTKARPKARKTYEGPTAEEKLVASLVELLEAGVNPWRKEWQAQASGQHRNLLTGHEYRGSNPALLEFQMAVRGSVLPLWLGAAQAKAKGWYPKKGSKGCYVVRPQLNSREQQDEQGKPITGPDGSPVIAAWVSFKPVCVFNAADLQGEGLEEAIQEALGLVVIKPEAERIEQAEKVLGAWHVKTTFGGGKACYSPAVDRICMPERVSFTSAEAFYATWAHEQVHSTGHSLRLKRDLTGGFGSKPYAREELVAELGAFLITRRLEISSDAQNHAAYLANWAQVLKEGPKVLYKVLSDATKAANLIAPEPEAAEEAS